MRPSWYTPKTDTTGRLSATPGADCTLKRVSRSAHAAAAATRSQTARRASGGSQRRKGRGRRSMGGAYAGWGDVRRGFVEACPSDTSFAAAREGASLLHSEAAELAREAGARVALAVDHDGDAPGVVGEVHVERLRLA